MKGSYLIKSSCPEGFEKRNGELVDNNGFHLGFCKEGKEWVITELSTGLKCNPEALPTKKEAEKKAEDPEFGEFLTGFYKDHDLSEAKRACMLYYSEKMDKDLASTFIKVFI